MPDFKKSNPHQADFYCSTAWHIKTSARCLAIYSFIGTITGGGKTPFFAKITRVAAYFDWSYEATRKAFHVLRKLGFLESIQPGYYKYVDHKEWAAKHPGQCRVRVQLPWQEEVDPLVGKMYALSGGKLRMMPYQVAALRKFADNDDAMILRLFTTEIEAAIDARGRGKHDGQSPNSCRHRVFVHLKNAWFQKQAQQNEQNKKS